MEDNEKIETFSATLFLYISFRPLYPLNYNLF